MALLHRKAGHKRSNMRALVSYVQLSDPGIVINTVLCGFQINLPARTTALLLPILHPTSHQSWTSVSVYNGKELYKSTCRGYRYPCLGLPLLHEMTSEDCDVSVMTSNPILHEYRYT